LFTNSNLFRRYGYLYAGTYVVVLFAFRILFVLKFNVL